MNYNGGKNGNGTYQQIINQIPPHEIYFELFAGSAAIYRFKKAADISILCDKSRDQCSEISKFINTGTIVLNCDTISSIKMAVTAAQLLQRLGHSVFWYLDPPYPIESRSHQKPIYVHELSSRDHIALLEVISRCKFPIAISTYENDIYSHFLKNWRLLQYQSIVRGGTRTESLYMNYPQPQILHDYRYLGDDFRKREAIKRQLTNTAKKLKSWPTSQLLALKDLLNEK